MSMPSRRTLASNSPIPPGLAYTGITINLNNGPKSKNPLGQDPRVRQALELSIDRAALNQVVFDGMFEPGNQWVSPGNPYYVKSLPIPPRDVAKAKQLLAAASVPNPVVNLMVPNNPEMMRAAEVIQAMAAEAGFDIRIEATEFATSLDRAAKGDFEAYLDRLERSHRSRRQHLQLCCLRGAARAEHRRATATRKSIAS